MILNINDFEYIRVYDTQTLVWFTIRLSSVMSNVIFFLAYQDYAYQKKKNYTYQTIELYLPDDTIIPTRRYNWTYQTIELCQPDHRILPIGSSNIYSD